VDIEIYGCLAYNNGWQESIFGNGHGIYAKSTSGPVYLRDNILFNQFGYGLHIYTIAGPDGLTNLHAEGNVSFNNGAVAFRPGELPEREHPVRRQRAGPERHARRQHDVLLA